MGTNVSQLTEEELLEYKEVTYLTRKEILHLFKIFKNINSSLISRNKLERISFKEIKRKIPEFRYNPFADELCKTFSSQNDQKLSFEDFLDMMSVLSRKAPLKKKAEYAFMIYDFDSDGFLSKDDLQELIIRLTGDHILSEDEVDKLIENILSEADLDNDELLSVNEFQHVIMKSSADFLSSFHMEL